MANLSTSTTCPIHLSAPATFTCKRCGTFGCERCKSPQVAGLCVACGERYATPGELVVGQTVQESFQFLRQRPHMVLAAAGAYAAFGVVMLPINLSLANVQAQGTGVDVVSVFPKILISAVVGFFFSTFVEAVLTRYVGDQLEGHERPLGETIRASMERLVSALGSNFMLTIAVSLGTALCILPGIFLSICLCLSIPAVMLGGKGAMESLSDSWALTAEHRGNVFLALLVSGLAFAGVALVSTVLQAILGHMGQVGTMLGLVVGQAFSGVGFSIVLTVLVFCYLKLSGRPISA